MGLPASNFMSPVQFFPNVFPEKSPKFIARPVGYGPVDHLLFLKKYIKDGKKWLRNAMEFFRKKWT